MKLRHVFGEFGRPDTFYIDAKEVSKAEYDAAILPPQKIKAGDDLNIQVDWSKPVHCVALAVHPKQRQAAIEDAIKKGVPTDFDNNGRPILTSREHQDRYLRAYGYFNKDENRSPGRYKGDVAPAPDPQKNMADLYARSASDEREQIVREIIDPERAAKEARERPQLPKGLQEQIAAMEKQYHDQQRRA